MTNASPSSRTKAEILQDLQEAKRAASILPALTEKAEAAGDLETELQAWENQGDWPQRQESALQAARSAVQRVHLKERELARYIGQIAESPFWRAALVLQEINAERQQLRFAAEQYRRIAYEKRMKEIRENGGKGDMATARAVVSQVASPMQIDHMIGEMDPGFTVYRAVPEGQREILRIVLGLVWPGHFAKTQPLDTDGR